MLAYTIYSTDTSLFQIFSTIASKKIKPSLNFKTQSYVSQQLFSITLINYSLLQLSSENLKMDLIETSRSSLRDELLRQELKRRIMEEDEDFVPINFKLEQKQKGEKKKRRPRECYKLWDAQQNKIFLEFLTLNRSSFQDLLSRRANKVFVNMAKLFPERNSHQCKSHYQKLQKMTKNKTIIEVIKYLEKKLKQQKVLHQKIIRGGQTGCPNSKQIQTGKLSIFHIRQKFFEIHLHINCDLISSW